MGALDAVEAVIELATTSEVAGAEESGTWPAPRAEFSLLSVAAVLGELEAMS